MRGESVSSAIVYTAKARYARNARFLRGVKNRIDLDVVGGQRRLVDLTLLVVVDLRRRVLAEEMLDLVKSRSAIYSEKVRRRWLTLHFI